MWLILMINTNGRSLNKAKEILHQHPSQQRRGVEKCPFVSTLYILLCLYLSHLSSHHIHTWLRHLHPNPLFSYWIFHVLLSINLKRGLSFLSLFPPPLSLPSFSSLASLYFSVMSKCLISAELWLMPLVVLLFLMSKISLNVSLAPSLPSLSVCMSLPVTALLLIFLPFSSFFIFISFTSFLYCFCFSALTFSVSLLNMDGGGGK